MTRKITIIGGGICGLGIGRELARAGASVRILEKNKAASGASHAAAGMLAPEIETEAGEGALSRLLIEARAAWPEYAADLEQDSGTPVFLRENGSLFVARDADDMRRLEFLRDLQKSFGIDSEMLSGYDARKMEPHLARGIVGALYHKQDAQVDNRAVCEALRRSFLRHGGVIEEDCAALEIISANDKATAVRTKRGVIESDAIVLAAGAWSADIAGLPQNCLPPVRPVKGQMLSLSMPQPLIEKLVWSADVYLVPQPDRLLIGASVEEMGFDNTVTAGAVKDLLQDAFDVLPGLYDLPILESWAGFRPTSRDDAPILGPTALDGLFVATGHHRNGILLAPLTARAMADLLLRGEMDQRIAPFTLARFAA